MDTGTKYEGLFDGFGTPIRCRSLDEVTELIKDMCQLFPRQARRLNDMARAFGKNRYEDEIVYRFAKRSDDHNLTSINFCTYDYYRREGYNIVEFSCLAGMDVADSIEDRDAFDNAFRELFCET